MGDGRIRMKKWIVMFLAFLCFTLGFSTVWASQVVDESDVLTAEQEAALNSSLSEFTSWSRQEMDILILPYVPRGESIEQYSERYVRNASENLDGGIVLVITMEDRQYYIAETGGMYQRVPLQGAAMDDIVESTESALHSGDYFGALDGFQKKVSEAVKAAPAATSSQKMQELPMGKKYPWLPPLVAFVMASIMAWAIRSILKNQMSNISRKADARDYVKPDSFHLTGQQDDFLYTTTQVIPKPRHNGGNGGGGGTGGRGGSF